MKNLKIQDFGLCLTATWTQLSVIMFFSSLTEMGAADMGVLRDLLPRSGWKGAWVVVVFCFFFFKIVIRVLVVQME